MRRFLGLRTRFRSSIDQTHFCGTAQFWHFSHLALRPLHVDFCDCERVFAPESHIPRTLQPKQADFYAHAHTRAITTIKSRC